MKAEDWVRTADRLPNDPYPKLCLLDYGHYMILSYLNGSWAYVDCINNDWGILPKGKRVLYWQDIVQPKDF